MEHVSHTNDLDPEELFQRRFTGTVRHTETGELLDVKGAEYEEIEELSLKGVYEHYKSTSEDPRFYNVNSIVRNLETGECLVLYIPLYETEDLIVAARPISMFTGSVTVDGEEIPRFIPRQLVY